MSDDTPKMPASTEHVTYLAPKDCQKFVEALEAPPEPNPALMELFARHAPWAESQDKKESEAMQATHPNDPAPVETK